MVAKITVSDSFAGVVNYIIDPKKKAEIVASNGVRLTSPKTIIESFETQRRMKPNIKRPAYHISLNFSPRDSAKVTPELIDHVIHRYLQGMGLDNTQFVAVRHFDKAHQHVHLCINRIDYNGKLISTKNDRIRNHEVCREITEWYGLHISSSNNMNYDRLRDHERCRILIRDALQETLPKAYDWISLMKLLFAKGITLEMKYKGSTATVEGIKLTMEGRTYSGSKIGREYSYSKINALFTQKREEEQQGEEVSYTRLHATEHRASGNDIINSVADLLQPTEGEQLGGGVNNELPRRRRR